MGFWLSFSGIDRHLPTVQHRIYQTKEGKIVKLIDSIFSGFCLFHLNFSFLSSWQLNQLQKSQKQLQSEQGQKSPGNKLTSDNSKEDSPDQQQRDDGASEMLSSLQIAHLALRLPVNCMAQYILDVSYFLSLLDIDMCCSL